MIWIAFSVLFVSAMLISYQDLTQRLISLWAILVFGAANYLLCFSKSNASVALENFLFCICYLLFLYLVLLLYFFIKTRQLKKIADTYVGWGDVLVILAIGINLEPAMLIYFFSGAFIVSLVISLFFIRKNKQVPLAGLLVVNYVIFTFVKTFVQ